MKIIYRTKRYGKWIKTTIPIMEKDQIMLYLFKKYKAIEWKRN